MAIKLTKEALAAMRPCDEDRRLALFGRKKSMDVKQALAAGATINDILWVAGRMGLNILCVKFALLSAQRVAHLNYDPRVQAAIDAGNSWASNPGPETAAYAAARAAAAYASADAADAAAYAAAYAAACAAGACAGACAAGAAARAADAAYAAARAAAAYARAAGACAAEEAAQKQLLIEVFG